MSSLMPRAIVVLDVPFPEKEEAKQLGAWWDPVMKKWFVPLGKDPKPFKKWLPNQTEAAVKPASF